MTIITNRFTTNYDLFTPSTIGVSARPSLLFDFAKAERADLRLSCVRSGTATRFNQRGFIENVEQNVPRVSFNPYTGECMGLLVEESRTNVVRNTQLGSYVSSDTQIGPDGQTAYKAVPTGSVTFPGVGTSSNQTFSLSGVTVGQSRDYSFSGYFAPHGPLQYRPYVVIGASGTSLTTRYALINFNPTTGLFSGKSYESGWSEVIAPKAEMHPCGMYYVTWTVRFTQPSTYSTISHYLQIMNENSQTTYTADGLSGFKLACMQFEQGEGVTSYIPTTTAAVTRNSDNNTYLTEEWFNPLEGTLYVEFSYGQKLVSTRVASIEASANDYIAILGSNSVFSIGPYAEARIGGTASFAIGPANPQRETRHRVMLAYSDQDYRYYVNGTTLYTNTASAVPQGLNTLYLGTRGGGDHLNGHIAKIAYYPKSFSTEELELTTA